MNFKRINGEINIQPYKKKASTAINIGDALYVDTDGFVLPADASSTGNAIVGISQETIAATDTDYASTRDIAVDVVDKGGDEDRFLAVVGTGTAAQTNVGEAHDLTSSGQVDLNATTTLVVKVERFIDTTHVIVSFLNTGDLS